VLVRGAFFTIYLGCVCVELEEFQVTRFILALKGFQFISGCIALASTCYAFWVCTALSDDGAGCTIHGPGQTTTVPKAIILTCYLQALLWFACLLLPFTGKFQKQTGGVSYERQRALWKEATAAVVAHETARQKQPSAQPADLEQDKDSDYRLFGEGVVEASDLFDRSRASLATLARRAYLVLTYSRRVPNLTQNRILELVLWDQNAFLACGLLFGLMTLSVMHKEERLDARTYEPPARPTLAAQWLYVGGLLVDGSVWHSWRTKISFAITKLVFSLSAMPFFPLSFGVINTLFTHADPTAYTDDGRLTSIDAVGLSAYCTWLKDDVLDASRFEHDFKSDFAQSDVRRLRKALEAGESFLKHIWEAPTGDVKARCLRKKLEIDAEVRSIITREVASDALYTHCFPDEVLVERYKAKLAKAAKAKLSKPDR